MPRFDRTGPEGKGARTGRGLGHCTPSGTAPRETDTGIFPRRRRASGRGWGLRFWRRNAGTGEE